MPLTRHSIARQDSSSGEFQEQAIELSETATSFISNLSEAHTFERNVLFQGIWAYLLSRYSSEEHVLFGIQVVLDPSEQGSYLQPLHVHVDYNASVVSWLQQLQAQWLFLQSPQQTPLTATASDPLSDTSLFESLIIFKHDSSDETQCTSLLSIDSCPLIAIISSTQESLEWRIWYDSQQFDSAFITRMLGHIQILLAGVFADPNQRLADLPILTPEEESQLLEEWTNTQVSYPRDQLVHYIFEAQAKQTPDKIALVFPFLESGTENQLSYQELNNRANYLAHHLQQRGVGIETPIAIMMERSLEMVVAILGTLKAGGIYVPLDPAYPKERLEFMLKDVQAEIILSQTHLVEALPAHQAQVMCLDTGWGADATASMRLETLVTSENSAYINYTSGSTGRPKGVAIPHRAVLRLVLGTNYVCFGADRTWLQLAPISFDAATLEIWGALLHGGCCVLFPSNGLPDPNDLKTVIQTYGVTSVWLTAALFNTIIAETPTVLTGIEELLTGGEALSVHHIRQAQQHLPTTQLINGYGPTESTTFTCCYPIPAPLPAGLISIPIGKPISNTQVYILDHRLQPVPIGVPGELFIGGDGLATHYLHQPQLTQERFIPHPFAKEATARLYKTGDWVRYLPDGNIEFIGRTDDQVKIRGYRVELGEIESILSQQHDVRDAVVLVHEETPGDKRLVAYVTPSGARAPSVSAIKVYLEERLALYMVPHYIRVLERMPLTPNGKTDRKALPKPILDHLGADYVAPTLPLEQALADLWSGILGLAQVGVEDNFFDLGGTSILALQLVARIQSRLELQLRAVKLYQYPTIRTMAQYLSSAGLPQTERSVQSAALSQNQDEAQAAAVLGGIAIIGMVGRFPGANTVEELWHNLCEGKESTTFFAAEDIDSSIDLELRADPDYVKAKGILQGAEEFDATFFSISPREAEVMDPQARVFLELAHQALEKVGYASDQFLGRIGLYAGAGQNTYFERHLCGRRDIIDRLGAFQTMLANEKDFVTTRASYKLNLTGPSVSVSTACSTSLVATSQAFQGLMNNDCDLALAGGISIATPQNTGYLYQEGAMLSPDGRCRPFDANARGTLFNNGAGIVVLKRFEDALEDGDRIYAVIKGVGINNDGADKVSFTAPSVNGQAGAISQAQATAGVDPHSISYIEAHGTATPLGDPIEIEALTQAFQSEEVVPNSCAIGSIKSNIGHTVAAAGVAGLIKTALALHHRQIPPSLGFESPNPQIDFTSGPFYVNTQLINWPEGKTPRRAGVSSFGVGGTNAHVVLQEAPAVQSSSPSRSYQLLRLSAKTPSALAQATRNLEEHLQQQPELDLADVAYTLHIGRKAFNHRRVLVARDIAEVQDILASLDMVRTSTREALHRSPEVVFMFPGQGSQYVNMGLHLYQHEPVFQASIDRCAEILQPLLKQDIRNLLYPATGEDEAATAALRKTLYTQPALFTIEYALAQLWLSWGIQPAAMIGHSIGEFVAACLADVFSLEDGLKLIASRGQMMWDLPEGSMLSVRLSAVAVADYLSDDLAIAAINGPSLCVVSGPTEEIAALQTQLEAEEVVCKALHTSHAFHSPMMDSIVDPFAKQVQAIALSSPKIPFVSTVTADWITADQAIDPLYWAGHLRATVRFAEGVQTLWQQPERVLLEVGPRLTTATLARQQAKNLKQQIAISSLGKTAETEWLSLMQAIGQLWLAGVELDPAAFYADEYRHRLPLPTYPFERQRYWIDPKPAAPLAPSSESSPRLQSLQSHSSTLLEVQTPTMSDSRKQRLVPLLIEVLETTSGLDITGVDETITFLEMGLDSLSLTQVALAFKKKFRIKITFRHLLENYPNLSTLADFVDQSLPPEAFPAPEITEPNPAPASIPAIAGVAPAPAVPELGQPSAGIASIPTIAPTPTAIAGQSSPLEALIAQQLQIVSQQLELLARDQAALPTVTPAVSALQAPPTSQATPLQPTPPSSQSAGKPEAQPPLDPKAKPSHGPGAKIKKSVDTTLTSEQQAALDQIIARCTARTQESKRQAQEHRRYLADPRTVSGFTPQLKEMVYPIVVNRSAGSKLWDVDGNEYVDLTNGFGLNLFGWNPDFVTQAVIEQMQKGSEIGPQTPLAGRVAKLFAEMTDMERVAFCNTGSEAVMATLRLARTVTGRSLVATFAGDYHGTFDEVLYRSGAKQRTLPAAPGILPSMFENLLVLDYDAPESLEILRSRADDLAAVLVEPVRSRDPGLQPKAFLQEIRKITEQSETAFIFDEVVTGFRVHQQGAQAHFNIKADLATYGKIVGGGLPIGVVAGKAEYMDALDGGYWEFGDASFPEVGVTFFAGTFVRHPMALAAAEAVLLKLKESGPELQQSLAAKVSQFAFHLNQHFERVGAPVKISYFSSLFYVTYSNDAPHGGLLFYLLREKGVHIWEYRPCFFTLAHSAEDIEFVIRAFKETIAELQTMDLLPGKSAAADGRNLNQPPQPGARLGRDPEGSPAWYIPDPERPGKYLQIGR